MTRKNLHIQYCPLPQNLPSCSPTVSLFVEGLSRSNETRKQPSYSLNKPYVVNDDDLRWIDPGGGWQETSLELLRPYAYVTGALSQASQEYEIKCNKSTELDSTFVNIKLLYIINKLNKNKNKHFMNVDTVLLM